MAAIGIAVAGAAAAARLGMCWGGKSWRGGQGSAGTNQMAGEEQRDRIQL